MSVPSSVLNAFARESDKLQRLERYVRETIQPWCNDRGYPFKGRLKSLESLSEKIETGRFEKWSVLDDLYGCTIVIPTAAHEAGVLTFLRSAFEEIELRLRNSTQKAPDVFRFDSSRYIGKVRNQPGLELVSDISETYFEVQIPTAFEYAWSVVTHDLVYKGDAFDWRKERLAAQIKASVEQIELLISGFSFNVENMAASRHDESDAKQYIVEAFRGMINEVISATNAR